MVMVWVGDESGFTGGVEEKRPGDDRHVGEKGEIS
jgi:hypothetical protein